MFRLILFIIINSALIAQEITVDWIYNRERIREFSIPSYQWIEDGTAIVLNRRIPQDQRTFQKFDPKTGRFMYLSSMTSALTSLRTLLPNDTTQILTWPLDINMQGTHAVYQFDNDLFLLDFKLDRFTRITDDDTEEKSARFSPDGQQIAYVSENNLYNYSIMDEKTEQLTTDGSETVLNGTLSWVYWEEIFGRRDIAYWWSDNSKYIAFLKTDETDVSIMHYVDFKPQTPRLIRQSYPKAGTKNPEVSVHIVDIGTGNIENVGFGYHQYEYVCRVQWLPDNQRLSIQTMPRAQTEVNLFFYELDNDEAKLILTETDTAWVNVHDDLYFLPDGEHFLWSSERDGFAHIYRYTMAGELVNQVTSGPWSLRSSGGRYWLRHSVLGFDDRTGYIYFTAQEASPLERHLYRIKVDGSEMSRITQSAGTHRIGLSLDLRYFMDTFSNTVTLPALSCFQIDTGKSFTLAESKSEEMSQYNMQFPETFTIQARDGFELPAQLLKPADFDPQKKYPLIFYVYGGPSAPTVSNVWQSGLYFDQILLHDGYLVARVDPRSSTAISKTLENTASRLISGPLELKDLLEAVSWFKSQSYIDSNRVGVWGWSGGGSFTLNALTNSTAFKAGISVAPVTDWHYYDTKFAEFAMKRPEDNPQGYILTSTVRSAKNLHGRLLLVHGTYDDNVHPQNSWHFIDELIKAGKMFDMMFYPMRKHSIRDLPARRHLFKTMRGFWSEHL
jgi:dipeptidyl-peptidase-4